jgi:hypothetical protein
VSNPQDDQIEAANRDVGKRVQYQADAVGGRTEQRAYTDNPAWAGALIDQFTSADKKACPHLHEAPVQPAMWLAMLPDLICCQREGCEQAVARELERRLGHSLADEPGRCSACGTVGLVKGVSVGVRQTMLRGLICQRCEAGE